MPDTIKRLVATGEWVICENVATATHLGPWPGIPPTGKPPKIPTGPVITAT